MWIRWNSNPNWKRTGDCVLRALSIATGYSWERVYIELCLQGFMMADWGNSNSVWGAYLSGRGFHRHTIPNTCPECYTVWDFCQDHPFGTYILSTGNHVVTVIDGAYIDSWDSGDEVPIYYYERS